jgi:hypothetical protein
LPSTTTRPLLALPIRVRSSVSQIGANSATAVIIALFLPTTIPKFYYSLILLSAPNGGPNLDP